MWHSCITPYTVTVDIYQGHRVTGSLAVGSCSHRQFWTDAGCDSGCGPSHSSKHGAYWSDGLIVNWRDNFFHHSLGYHKLFINAVILQTKFPYILCPGAVAASTLLSSVDSSSSDGGSAGTLWCCFMIAASRRSICRERREREASSEELNRALYSCAIYTWFQHNITSVSTLAHSGKQSLQLVSCKLHTREKTRKASQASQN